MLQDPNPTHYDLALIQEPVINFVNLTTSNSQWNVVYPSTHNKEHAKRTRSVILVNKNLSKDSWHSIPIDSPDITAIELNGTFGCLHIYNIYNDITHNDTISLLNHHLSDIGLHDKEHPMDGILLMGDFN